MSDTIVAAAEQGGLSREAQAEVRSLALETLSNWRDAGSVVAPIPVGCEQPHAEMGRRSKLPPSSSSSPLVGSSEGDGSSVGVGVGGGSSQML